jgi:hypothetical protein
MQAQTTTTTTTQTPSTNSVTCQIEFTLSKKIQNKHENEL